MDNYRCNLKFIWEGAEGIPETIKEAAIKEYLERRSIAVDIINPCLEYWNKEFDLVYPGYDGYSKEYTQFIANRQDEIFRLVNRQTKRLDLLMLKTDRSEENALDIIGELYLFNRAKLKVVMTDLELQESGQ